MLGVVAALALAVLALVGLDGCSGTQSNPTVVRVGRQSIGKRSVDHWASIIDRGALVSNPTNPTGQSPRQQALSLLIASAWLNQEAARVGLRPSREELARIVQEQKDATPNGPGAFAAALAETGQTLSDVEAEARARWEARALGKRLVEAVGRDARAHVTNAMIVGFYRAHLAQYHLRERRYYDLIERIHSRAEAAALAKRVGTGRSFARKASKEHPYRPPNFANLPGQAITYRAVFAAKKTGVIVGPLPLQGEWCLFVLRRIAPARLQPLAEVRGKIERSFLDAARRKAQEQMVGAYRRRSIAATDCRPGYVVQKCRQYKGTRAAEPAPFAGF